MSDAVQSWAASEGVELLPTEATTPEHDPRGDFGRVVRGTPSHVLRPADVAGLSRTLRFLAERRLPYRLRGAAWSSGGQVVMAGGVVVDLTRLDRILDDRPAEGEVTVEGGATWRALAAHLRGTGRRPLTVPDNLHNTVGGSLAIADLGDASSVHGLVINQVRRLTLVTPDGEIRKLTPADKLFRFALGGSGLCGAIAEATLATVARPPTLASRTLAWTRIEGFCTDAALNSDLRLYEQFQGVLTWMDGAPILYALAGNFASGRAPVDQALWELKPSAVAAVETTDRLEKGSARVAWDLFRPAVQVSVPMIMGAEVLRRLVEYIRSEPVMRAQIPRVGLLVYRTDLRFPLAPQPDSPLALALICRPQVAQRDAVGEVLPFLRTIGQRAVEIGGRVSLSGILPDVPDFAALQLGPALDELRRIKEEIDPHFLCNHGLLPGLNEG
jgi:FAD/FMN-containing dehydrogenase